jgi:Ala-tRNA(Pro) deacylase
MEKQVFQTIINILKTRDISYTLFEHEPVYTMDQAREVCGNLPEQDVKVLFARTYSTKKYFGYCLIVWTGNKQVDFQKVSETLGAKKVKLATPEEVKNNLGIEIGALSPFGYDGSYPVVLESSLLNQTELFINPGDHRKTIKLNPQALRSIIEETSSDFYLL